MSTNTREVIWGGKIMGADMRAQTAHQEARKAARAASRAEAEGVVGPHGRLWRASAAEPNDRPMPERRLRLAGDRVLSLQDTSELTLGCDPQGARHADLEVRTVVPMPLMGTRRYKPPVRMVKLTERREITPYKWVHLDEEH